MSVDETVLERFSQKNPLAVMMRCLSGQVICEELDQVFHESRSACYEGQLKFSVLASTVAEIALGTVDNPNQAYRDYAEQLKVSKTAYYDKLNHVETNISEATVRYSARQTAQLQQEFGGGLKPLEGYNCLVIDGNHLQKTEKRLNVLRGLQAASLPGTVVARYDLQSQLLTHAYLLENAHAQEASVLDRVIEDLKPMDLIIADRHFCIVDFLQTIDQCQAAFVIRHHGRLKGELIGERKKKGTSSQGTVSEQTLKITGKQSSSLVRRITLELKEPTSDGETVIHILSNVPKGKATAVELAALYHQRWEVENVFHLLTMTLTCELKSLGQPKAALFLFCMAMVAFNARQVLLRTLLSTHEAEAVEQMSQFQMAKDIEGPMEGMCTALPEENWNQLVGTSQEECVALLRRVAKQVPVKKYRKSKRGVKKPPPARKKCKKGTHVAAWKRMNGIE